MDTSSIPYKFAEPWGAGAAGGFVTSPIPDIVSSGTLASQHLGFPPATATPTGAGGVPPGIADFNGVFQYLSSWAQWQQAGAPVPYDATFSADIGGYPKGAEIASATFPLSWISVAENNTTDPDTGGTNWVTRQSLEFPTGLGTINANATMTGIANAGRFYNVGGSGVVVTLNASTFYVGQTIGFLTSSACTVTTSSGTFYNGSLSGASINMPAGSFVALQWDGLNWRQLAGSFLGEYVKLSHMGLAGAAFSTGTGNFSTSASFTPAFDGVMMINGNAGAVGGGIFASSLSAPGASLIGGYTASASQGGTNNVGIVNAAYTVAAGVPVTVTYAINSAGTTGSSIGFTYSVNPTS